ncbi:hypothetical protein Nepgr_021334 [Nepenthes gracilis]|uniref:Uncharacterized protein n=1 Tax=Nepenthes gracilis TaxID=150966 RepID=A0AAD3SXZ5_NEPGR|nr:hypothetical protein Nepgr_021334 [Nepenthes gracilis]
MGRFRISAMKEYLLILAACSSSLKTRFHIFSSLGSTGMTLADLGSLDRLDPTPFTESGPCTLLQQIRGQVSVGYCSVENIPTLKSTISLRTIRRMGILWGYIDGDKATSFSQEGVIPASCWAAFLKQEGLNGAFCWGRFLSERVTDLRIIYLRSVLLLLLGFIVSRKRESDALLMGRASNMLMPFLVKIVFKEWVKSGK